MTALVATGKDQLAVTKINPIPQFRTETGSVELQIPNRKAPIPRNPITVDQKQNPKEVTLKSPHTKIDPEILKDHLSNPNLSDNDRSLFQKYVDAVNQKKDSREIKQLIKNRIISLKYSQLKDYTGREDLENKELDALFNVVNYLNMFSAKDIKDIRIESSKAFLSATDQTLLDNYRKHRTDTNLSKILNRMAECSKYWQSTIWGTPERAEVHQKMAAFNDAAVAYDVPLKKLRNAADLDSEHIAKLDNETQSLMRRANRYLKTLIKTIETPNKKGDLKIKEKPWQFLSEFEAVAQAYFGEIKKESPNIEKILVLGGFYSAFEYYAVKIGIPRNNINEMENKVISQTSSLKLGRKNGIEIYKPEELPEEMKDVLMKTKMLDDSTYFQFIKANVNFLVFTPIWPESKTDSAMLGGNAGGYALGGGIILINTQGLDITKNASYFWETILHESNHEAWRRTYALNPDKTRESVSNEGDAFQFGADGITDILKEQAEYPKELELLKMRNQYLAKGAAHVLWSFDFKHKKAEGIDTNIYPTNTPIYEAYRYAEYFVSKEGIKRKVPETEIIKKLMKSDLNYSYDKKSGILSYKGIFTYRDAKIIASCFSKEQDKKLIMNQVRFQKRKIEILVQIFKELIENKLRLEDVPHVKRIGGVASKIIHGILAKINPAWGKISYKDAVTEFKSQAKTHFDKDYIVYEYDYLKGLEYHFSSRSFKKSHS